MEGIKEGNGKWRKNADQPNCNEYEGDFANDCKHGLGLFHWESGNRYHGHYINDQRQGYGEMFWNDGSVYVGHWSEGHQEGEGILRMPNGRIKQGIFHKNQFTESCEVNLPEPFSDSVLAFN